MIKFLNSRMEPTGTELQGPYLRLEAFYE